MSAGHQCLSCHFVQLESVEESPQSWRCPKCRDMYYSCAACEDGLDWAENDQGSQCYLCGRHWCLACVDNTIHFKDWQPYCAQCWTAQGFQVEL